LRINSQPSQVIQHNPPTWAQCPGRQTHPTEQPWKPRFGPQHQVRKKGGMAPRSHPLTDRDSPGMKESHRRFTLFRLSSATDTTGGIPNPCPTLLSHQRRWERTAILGKKSHTSACISFFASMMVMIDLMLFISAKSFASKCILKVSSKTPQRDKWPTESHPEMSVASVSMETKRGSRPKTSFRISRTLVKTVIAQRS